MNIIYLHGFQSNSRSMKGLQLQQYCQQHHPQIKVHLPDINMPPAQVMQYIQHALNRLEQVVLVGSSLGGFYASCAAIEYGCAAVLINPVIRPWQVFQQRFPDIDLPYRVHENWLLQEQDMLEYQRLHQPKVHTFENILVLLQQGDEVLDYREAERYYRQATHGGLVITETGGQHAMCNFADKIPMLLTFLSQRIT